MVKAGKTYWVGSFPTEFQAFKIANVYAYRLFGRFAYLNNWSGPTRLCPNCGVFEKKENTGK